MKTSKPRRKYKFSVRDQVRISHLKYTFQRDYQQKWTEEIFKIRQRFRIHGFNLYSLVDLLDETVEGHFYEQELQRVSKDLNTATFRVEKVIKTRRRNGETELLVKWMGWPTKFNSWTKQADVQSY